VVGPCARGRDICLFRLGPDRGPWGRQHPYNFKVRHRWGLPGVRCGNCGQTWATFGQEYPAIDLSGLPNERKYRRPKVASPEEYQRLSEGVLRLLPAGAILGPGADFGPLTGKGHGPFGDFAWPESSIPLVKRPAYDRLRDEGITGLVGVPTEISFPARESPSDFLELHVEPFAHLQASAFSSRDIPCPLCGWDRSKAERLIVARSSIPGDRDLFRIWEWPAQVLATERFRDAATALALADISFEEVELAT